MATNESFEWTEWLVFGSMTFVILATTLYFSGKKSEHVVRGTMGVFPITMTIVASNISAAAFRGVTEVYQYGFYYVFEFIPITLGMIICHFQIPVFCKLKLPSVNKYFEMRFDQRTTIFSTTLFFMALILNSAFMCYAFGLFLGQITGLSDIVTVSTVAGVTLFLSAVGGFKGIVWTDTIQCLAILGSLIFLMVVGVKETGGFERVYEQFVESDRFEVDWSLDPTKRSTGWALIFGLSIIWNGGTSLASPFIYQRFMALPTENHWKWANVSSAIVTITIKLLVVVYGILTTVYYQGCDPVSVNRVHSYDQIFAFFVQDIGGRVKLVRSIYLIAYITSGISTMSTIIHTLATIINEDFYKRFVNRQAKPKHEKRVMILALTGIALVWILSVKLFKFLGNVNDLVVITGSTTFCIYCAIHVMAIFMPFINAKGAFWSGLTGFATAVWIQFNSSRAIAAGLISYPMKEMRVDSCNFNVTVPKIHVIASSTPSNVFLLFRVSSYFIAPITFIVVLIVASLVSVASRSDRPLNKNLFSPLVWRFIRDSDDLVNDSSVVLERLKAGLN